MAASELESISPQECVEWYIDHRRDDVRYSTRQKQQSGLGIFDDWTKEYGLDDMNDLGGRELMRFKTWRKNQTQINTISLNGTLAVLQRFLRFCETINAVPSGLADDVPLPNVPGDEEISDVVPTDEEVAAIREYYSRFEYASRRQVQLELISEIGLRLGSVRAIDLMDFDASGQRIQLVHRPEGPDVYGTPLKNGVDGQRIVNLSPKLTKTIQSYIENRRVAVDDRFGRSPLFTSEQGRVSMATIRRDFYKLTRPCMYDGKCPHDRVITDCEATNNTAAWLCPSRFSTHPLRRWSIMNQLDEGVPVEHLSDRVDVSVPVLEKHYDMRTEDRKSQRRLEVLRDNLPAFSNE